MRKLTTILLAAAVLAGAAAQTAAADDPAATFTSSSGSYSRTERCTTRSTGVKYQYGAWGYYVDGCTTRRVYCATYTGCWLTATSRITGTAAIYRVTQNMRARFYNRDGVLTGWADNSCEGTTTCQNVRAVFLKTGDSATVQCNGVQGLLRNYVYSWATNDCSAVVDWNPYPYYPPLH